MKLAAVFVLSLSAEDLYQGFEAHNVVLKDGAVVLAPWAGSGGGRVVTDVLDLGGDDTLSTPVTVKTIGVKVTGEGAEPTVSVRTGSTFFQSEGTWTDWQAVGKGPVKAAGRYVQVRLEMPTGAKVTGLQIAADRDVKSDFKGRVEVKSADLQHIVTSPVAFQYERQDQADLVWMRKTFGLDRLIAGRRSELEKLAILNQWVATRTNNRTPNWHPKTKHYPWDIRVILRDEEGGTIYGHCGSYCVVLITAAQALGWQGRHIANSGYRRRSHEVPEIWVNEVKKWVYFDPSLDAMYYDGQTNKPMNAVEMHEVFLKYMYPNGAVQGSLNVMQQRANNKAIDWSTFPVNYVSDLWAYGRRTQSFDFWHWGQGLMTCGRLQMTPRNNFHSKPEPYFTRFGHGPGSERTFPYWADGQTPASARLKNVHTRRRDWYWTLNQAAMRLVRTADDRVTVELGTSQPHFRRYVGTVNTGEPATVTSPYAWHLRPGTNTLEVNCEDEFGNTGLPSKVVLEYAK